MQAETGIGEKRGVPVVRTLEPARCTAEDQPWQMKNTRMRSNTVVTTLPSDDFRRMDTMPDLMHGYTDVRHADEGVSRKLALSGAVKFESPNSSYQRSSLQK